MHDRNLITALHTHDEHIMKKNLFIYVKIRYGRNYKIREKAIVCGLRFHATQTEMRYLSIIQLVYICPMPNCLVSGSLTG